MIQTSPRRSNSKSFLYTYTGGYMDRYRFHRFPEIEFYETNVESEY